MRTKLTIEDVGQLLRYIQVNQVNPTMWEGFSYIAKDFTEVSETLKSLDERLKKIEELTTLGELP